MRSSTAIETGDPLEILARMEPLEGFCGGRSGEDCAARTNADADGAYVAHRFEDGGSLAWSMPLTTMTRLVELALEAEERALALAVVDEQSWDGQTNLLAGVHDRGIRRERAERGERPRSMGSSSGWNQAPSIRSRRSRCSTSPLGRWAGCRHTTRRTRRWFSRRRSTAWLGSDDGLVEASRSE